MEIWKNIEEFNGKYQVSNLGRIRRVYKKGIIPDKFLKTFKNKQGYVVAPITINNIQKNRLVHRLVANAFIPKIDGKLEINHKDEDKENNCVENLEWCTHKENSNYGTRNIRLAQSLKKYFSNRLEEK